MSESDARSLSPPELLRAAARLIGRAMAQMDTETETCRCCGLHKMRNRTQGLAHQRLEPTIARLRREADALDGIENTDGTAADVPQED